MKRMIIALLLLGIIICTAFVTSHLAEKAIEKTCDALKECVVKEQNEKYNSLKISEAVSVWNRNKKILYAVMYHEDFFEIEKNMLELECLSQCNNFAQSDCLCAKTELLLRNKKEDTKHPLFLILFFN